MRLDMKTTIGTDKLLDILKKNKTGHTAIVAEARKTYVERAKVQLLEKLDRIEKGEVVALDFSLRPPVDYSAVYDTAIKMVEMNTSKTVELESDAFRNLVMDEWDWSRDFYLSNSAYSVAAARESVTKGYRH